MKIRLEDLKIFAYHGVYNEERSKGQWFEIQCEIDCIPGDIASDELEQTIDYVSIYKIIESVMSHPSQLLENVLYSMHTEILSSDTRIERCRLKLTKLKPPIPGLQGKVSVEYP